MRMRKSGFTPAPIDKSRTSRKLVRGFTLIEMVIVFLVIGIIAIVILTDINKSLSANRLEAARWRLKSDIIYAQSLAVTQQVNQGVIFDPANNTYSVYSGTPANIINDPLTHAPMTRNYATDKNFQGVAILFTSFGSPTTNRLEFDKMGIPYSDNGVTPLVSNGTVTFAVSSFSSIIVTVTKNTGKVS